MIRQVPVILLLASIALGAWAQTPADRIRQGEARQQQIRTQTQNVGAQLSEIIDEFKRNGLDGEDVAVLEAIRSVLGKLSDREMQRVIELLQSARSVADPNASRKSVATAVADQKGIVVQLRALLLEYQRQQALSDLALRLAALAERQHGNLKVTVELAKAAAGRTGAQFDDTQRASLQVQHAEQNSIRDEVNPLLLKLETMAKDADGPTKERVHNALAAAKQGNLKPVMESAVDDLKAANLYRAAGSQKTVRDQLRELARQIAPPKDAIAAMQQALKEIEKAIEQQRQVVFDTKLMPKDRGDKAAFESLEVREADLVDRSDLLRKDLMTLAPDAANELKGAIDEMQEARADLSDRQRDKAVENENAGLEKLESAKSSLEQAIAKAEPKGNEDKLAATKELQERVRAAIKAEEEIKSATATNERKRDELKKLAPKQAELEAQTRQLQQDVAWQAPMASLPIGDAATQMDKSEQRLAKPDDPRTAQEAQAAAIASLKQADEFLARQAQQLEEAQKELAAMLDARAKIQKLIEQQQQVEMTTARAAALNGKKSPGPASGKGAEPQSRLWVPSQRTYFFMEEVPAAKDIASDQQKLAQETEQVKGELSEAEKVASQPLDDARRHMVDAKSKLEQSDAAGAQPAQQEALTNLFRAKQLLDQRIAQLQGELGQNPFNPAEMAGLAEQLEQLRKQVNQTSENLDPQALKKSLEQQQREIAKTLDEMGANKPDASGELAAAQKSANQAADQVAQGQFGEAAKSMSAAEKGMQSAAQKQSNQNPAGEQGQTPQEKLGALSEQQESLRQQAESMAANQEAAAQQQAASEFGDSSKHANQMANGASGVVPNSAVSPLQQAAQALSGAAAEAAAGNTPGAQAKAADAQAALAQAQAAVALAQAGLGQQGQQGQQGQGQGQPAPNSAQAQGQQPGQGQGQGQQQKGQGQTESQGKGTGDRESIKGGSFAQGDKRNETAGGQFIALPERDRRALVQSQGDKYPEEYAPQIEQYLKNLSESDKP